MVDHMEDVTSVMALLASEELLRQFPHTWEEAMAMLAEKIRHLVETSQAPTDKL